MLQNSFKNNKSPLKLLRFCISGLVKGTNYHLRHYLSRGMYPTFLIYQFTQKCNSKCIMCNIWKERPENELGVDEIAELLSRPFFQHIEGINLTGGEVFLRDDLVETIRVLTRHPKLKTIGISTNGFNTGSIISKVKAVLPDLEKAGMTMVVKVSIDGVERVHDSIRGITGGYGKALETFRELLALNNSHLNTGFATVIMNANADVLDDLLEELPTSSNVSFILPSFSEGYFNNEGDNNAVLSPPALPKISSFLREQIYRFPEQSFFNTKLLEYISRKRRTFSCLAGFRTLYMDNHGELYPCPILSQEGSPYRIGNAKNEDAERKFFSGHGNKIRKMLKSEKTCRSCIFSCDLKNNLNEEFFEFFTFYLKHPYYLYLIVKKMKSGKIRSDYLMTKKV